jgi:hypothetical protein
MSPIRSLAPLALMLAGACAGCAHSSQAVGASSVSVAESPSRSADAGTMAQGGARPRFFWRSGMRLGHPQAAQIVNANGTPRIFHPEMYDAFWRDVAPKLQAWAADSCLALNPSFVAALLAKESGFDPGVTSGVPAIGYAQITETADADLLERVKDVPCMREAVSWPRHPVIHSPRITKARADSLIAAGTVNARNEYLLDPVLATRAGMFELRLIENIWRRHEEYAPFARRTLNAGRPLTEDQVLDLVTVSYNQGYLYVHQLMERHGADWKQHLNPESRDYLERIRTYTALFQQAPGGR